MKMNQKTDSSLLKNWIKVGLIMPFVLIAVLLQSCFNNAEEESDSKEPVENELQTVIEEKSFITSDTLFTVVEVMPEFPGGSTSMIEFVKGNLSYPADAKEKGIEGRVFVNFVVETDGSISNAQILRGIGGGCDEEAVRVVAKMPNWTPGYQRGQAVRVSFNMPILFALNGKE